MALNLPWLGVSVQAVPVVPGRPDKPAVYACSLSARPLVYDAGLYSVGVDPWTPSLLNQLHYLHLVMSAPAVTRQKQKWLLRSLLFSFSTCLFKLTYWL